MWCDLLKESNLPLDTSDITPSVTTGEYAEITYAGAEPHIKVNGSYKKITLTYYSTTEDIVDQTPGEWSFWIDDVVEASDLIKVLETDSPNILKIKFIGGEEYLGKVLTVKNTRNDVIGTLQLQIVSL